MTALTAQDAATWQADLKDTFLAFGADTAGDVDAAFDDAVEQAGYDHGFAGLVPSIAAIDADQVTVTDLTPLTLSRALMVATRELHAGQVEEGRAYALPICADSAYKRRRARLTITEPSVPVAETAGALTHVSSYMERTLLSLSEEAGTGAGEDELLEAAEVTSARHRYKALVSVFKGGSVSEYVVLDPATHTVVSAGHKSAGKARAAAVEMVKQGPIGGSATGYLDIHKITGRGDDKPFMQVTRNRVASRVTVKMTFASLKNPEKTKTIGWLFYGRPASADAQIVEPTPTPPEAGAVQDL